MLYNRSPVLAIHLALLINTLSIGSLMMVMPLGPDFVRHIGLQASHVGHLSGAALLAAAFSAALSAAWLDRLPRRRALIGLLLLRFSLLGCCALADSPVQLTLLFLLSGLAAGPLGAILIAAVLDLLAPAERGRKLAYLSMGYSLAAIIAVPLALELAIHAGWQAPFLLFGGLGVLCALLARLAFPTSTAPAPGRAAFRELLRSPLCLIAFLAIGLQMFGHFLLVPHLSHFFQFNLEFPRERIGLLYLCGGLASLVALHLSGRWIDRGQAVAVVLIGSLGLALITATGFGMTLGLSAYLIFTLFMALGSVRTSSTMTIVSGIPRPEQRAGFMALQSTVGNVAAGCASLASAAYLQSADDQHLIGFEHLAWLYVLLGLLATLGVLLLLREKRLQAPAQRNKDRQDTPADRRNAHANHSKQTLDGA